MMSTSTLPVFDMLSFLFVSLMRDCVACVATHMCHVVQFGQWRPSCWRCHKFSTQGKLVFERHVSLIKCRIHMFALTSTIVFIVASSVFSLHLIQTYCVVMILYPLFFFFWTKSWSFQGGKFANWEGGIRVNAFVSGGFLPPSVRGTKLTQLVAGWDW